MITNRYIIKAKDFIPIKNAVSSRVYLSASFATSSCNWDDHVYCDVTIADPIWTPSTFKWMTVTGSGCHFISAI